MIRKFSRIGNVFIRGFSSKPVRVRFAPSPTGHLHLGGLRTALYNYLFALSKGGKMVLRIEDTDQARLVEGAQQALEESLRWAGVLCNEGPTAGGAHGPYVQSERKHIYQQHVQELVASGSAYHCFCSVRRLELLRREAVRSRQVPRYDNKCRQLTREEAQQKMSSGEQACIRFKLSDDVKVFEDLVYGSIAYDVTLTEGDPVIMKVDGLPTYHLANVVDDHLMEISHVLRGVEWQISTTKHIMLYKAFGWSPPQFGHLPLILNPDGSKLSKRQGDVYVQQYRDKGVLPLALINYLTQAGGGYQHVPGEGIKHHTMQELAEEFRLEAVNSNSTRLNPDLLTECNRLEIIEQIKDKTQLQNLICHIQKMVQAKFQDSNLQDSTEHIESVLKWSSGRITKLEDLVGPSLAFLWVLPSQNLNLEPSNVKILKQLKARILEDDIHLFDVGNLSKTLWEFCGKNGVKFGSLMKLVRSVLSGLDEGPGVAEMILVLGKETTIQRIDNAIKL